ncbi:MULTISPECIES: polyprenyl synthetase family protein [unclassified Paenibacillus]|uniref:polyprenyl synthetase family protein n=1 Tax=unclassified Paenibacillus TaxID=185978 RepID=UPI00240625D0|nr:MULTISPECIES: farnesyl diphosphate synthase [unclassified Paenibacillus]MDF9840477.1 geranylgeranyl diphosphate synthase type II [Paenibacillus sp. PastF-2]MDF9847059.1 geranylgeranyl diphosphate synthase type II [Paenibacillus sp. PastM-2]MDF9853631.1 geranylgeranyl diphosphate synthase type II [Paenibacillus sp. PastF-1]MDH6478883.1 geranylgeranyl diphosphate synthase type II [Paenibacillus sp. PastH-2]MDH6506615.1 geranylgeranyl diphosphate synthase type II [Paenibacillus sp. PastM-3]
MSRSEHNPELNAAGGERQPLKEYIAGVTEAVLQELETTLPADWTVPGHLKDAMNYSLQAGGKRLRPLLVVAACEALGGSRDAALPVAAAIEMVHTYSLIHDDLPAMDNDDYRRGKLTSHKVFGEATAILAGDALLTHAFYSVVQSSRRHGVPAEQVLSIVEELAEMAGPRGMVGGQVADMEGEQGLTSLEQLQYIHRHKTGDLIVCSLLAGGRIAGADAAQLEALREFGTQIGLAFQVQDDILDLVGDEGKLGKKTGSDIKQQKVTYPFFIGLEASRAEVERLTEAARSAVLGGGFKDNSRLLEIASYLMSRDH